MRHLHHPKWVTPSIIEGMSCDESATFLKILHILPLLDRITQPFQTPIIYKVGCGTINITYEKIIYLLKVQKYYITIMCKKQ